jgi:uncharacterized protein YpmS
MSSKENLKDYKKASDKRSREPGKVTKDRRDLVEVINSHLEALKEIERLKGATHIKYPGG